jgi:hypothetical protein
MCEVKDNMTLISLRKSIFVKSYALRAGEFYTYPIILKKNLVVSRRGLLCLVQKSRTVARPWIISTSSPEFQRANCRYQKDISIIGHSSSAQMGVTKAIDHIVGYVVPGTAIPTRQPRIRAQLHHTKRESGARIGMTMPTGADKRIDKLGQRFLILRHAGQDRYQGYGKYRNKKKFFPVHGSPP